MLSLSIPIKMMYNIGCSQRAVELAIDNILFLEEQNSELLNEKMKLERMLEHERGQKCKCSDSR